ncbi:MAG: ABC transporter permease [Candidatus Thorarchaeota archaeon]|nr:ABC transporter permease [Candidatus Thorarchaeota archaeon]
MAESKKNWKDSNWYVSGIGFWREFRKHRIGLIGLSLIIIFVSMAIFAPLLVTHNPSPQAGVAPQYLAPAWLSVFDSGAVITGDYLEDPFLNEAPAMGVNGTSDEFSYLHQPIDAFNNQSYVNLTWTHTAGTQLDYRWNNSASVPSGQDPDKVYADYNDYVFFDQTVDWPWNAMPSDVNMSISFATERTGDFAPGAQTLNNLMFRIYVWVIDSGGEWTRIYESRDATYTDVVREKPMSLNFWSIESIFGGMVSLNGTLQEDPYDNFTIRVGLSPFFRFESYLGVEPWDFYNGTVEIKVTQLKMVAYGQYFGILGTTNWGADAYSQLIYGSRISLIIGVLATGLSTGVGVIVGMVAGYFGGKIDELLMRIVDFLLVIPGLPLMMVLAAILGPSIENIIIVIAILGWTGTSRLIRSQVLAEKNKAYVESARAIGASDTYIMFKHILPNVTPILFANITLGVVGAILSEAGLSFLGLTNPEDPSWGRMLADARTGGAFSTGAWWVVVFPGAMITLLSLAFTFVGHTLDQVLNPRLRER